MPGVRSGLILRHSRRRQLYRVSCWHLQCDHGLVKLYRVSSWRILCVRGCGQRVDDADERRELLKAGRPNQDAFLLLAMALEARARDLGRLPANPAAWRPRNRRLLGLRK